MVRIYYAMIELDTNRPGGPWWYRDVAEEEAVDFLAALLPVATAIRTTRKWFPVHGPDIAPPEGCEVVK